MFPNLAAGLATSSNQFMQGEMGPKEQKDLLLQYSDQLRLSMAGNLQDYQMESFKASMSCVMNDMHSRRNIGCWVQVCLEGLFLWRMEKLYGAAVLVARRAVKIPSKH